MAAGGGDAAWSAWEVAVTFLGGSGLLTSISAIFWFGRKYGQSESQAASLRSDLDSHTANDEKKFDQVEQKIDRMSEKVADTATRGDLRDLGAMIQSGIQALTVRVDSAFRRGE